MENWNQEINKYTDWGGDSSTSGFPVSGEAIQEFIKSSLQHKIGYIHKQGRMYYGFADEEDAIEYINTLNRDLIIASWEDGTSTNIQTLQVYKWSSDEPVKPTTTNVNNLDNGWTYTYTLKTSDEEKLWTCWCKVSNDVVINPGWQGPVKLQGDDGAPGEKWRTISYGT